MNILQNLKIVDQAIELSVLVYEITKQLPDDEKFGLVSQMRRCSVSIASNIAEGAGRNGKNEFIYFLGIANGSCYELETQLIIALRLSFINQASFDNCLVHIQAIRKMNYSLQQKLKNNNQ